MTWLDHPARTVIADNLGELRRAIDLAGQQEDAAQAFTFLEIALNHLSAARAAAWDHLEGGERSATVANLDFCGIPHPLLRGNADLTLD